jgi:hypothetical protein
MADSGLSFSLVDADSFAFIPAPAEVGARCQTCDYWERLDGHREASTSETAADLKLSRLLAGTRLAGAYGMLAWNLDAAGDRVAVGPRLRPQGKAEVARRELVGRELGQHSAAERAEMEAVLETVLLGPKQAQQDNQRVAKRAPLGPLPGDDLMAEDAITALQRG